MKKEMHKYIQFSAVNKKIVMFMELKFSQESLKFRKIIYNNNNYSSLDNKFSNEITFFKFIFREKIYYYINIGKLEL